MPERIPVAVYVGPIGRPDLIVWSDGMLLHPDFAGGRFIGIVWQETATC